MFLAGRQMHRECKVLRHSPPAHSGFVFGKGHRTYAAFIHLLTCVVLLSIYVATLCIQAVYFAFTNPLAIVSTAQAPIRLPYSNSVYIAAQDESTPLHDIYLAFYGIIMGLVFGSFWTYHLYLTTCVPPQIACSLLIANRPRAPLSLAYIPTHPGRTRRRSRTSPPSSSSATSRRCRARHPVRAPSSSPTRRCRTSSRTHSAASCATRTSPSDSTTSAGAATGRR